MPTTDYSSHRSFVSVPEDTFSDFASLLENLVDTETAEEQRRQEIRPFDENRLIQVRLGIASGLFTALRLNDPSTARHSLRVALWCSSWASWLQLGPDLRDALELAALLHDIGKIGVPDSILRKPGPLDSNEMRVMDGHRAAGSEILASCCARPEVRQIVTHAAAWFDGSRSKKSPAGTDIPFGARMLAIVDAFDAMLSAQVYRRALPRERALIELQRQAGRQFDPELVRRYIEYQSSELGKLPPEVARDWLTTLDPEIVNDGWRRNDSPLPRSDDQQRLFRRRLLENMHDAVIFVDSSLRIVQWNAGAERLTGISSDSAIQRNWLPSVVNMCNDRGKVVDDTDCPVAFAIRSRVQWLRRLNIRGRERTSVIVNAHAVPTLADDGSVHGAMLIMRDASQETSLEERCEDLHKLATKDPLTELANRAEFDRVHVSFMETHLDRRQPCSLVICDIDRFKAVNDNHGHQAGDAVIQSFAQVLQGACRAGDLAARYGGEEFVLLCAGCDTATAAMRAEKLRSTFAAIKQPALNGEPITASFGVTSIQAGDTAETMLRRADRALLRAKDSGRNRVVQLGTGVDPEEPSRWRWWRRKRTDDKRDQFFVQQLKTDVPIPVTVEKLRGFIADHHAEVVSIDNSTVNVQLNEDNGTDHRRAHDRPLRFCMELQFASHRQPDDHTPGGLTTRIRVTINPQRSRDRRRNDAADRARRLTVSLRAYLMATIDEEEFDENDQRGVIRLAKHLFTPLLGRR